MSDILVFYLTLSLTLTTVFAGDIGISVSPEDKCKNLESCATCLDKKYCTWCVTKNICTENSCGNDNVIYPSHVKALMSGRQLCPRVVDMKKNVFKSGQKEGFVVKITQIYLYMAFTPWKCKVTINGNKTIVNAVLLGDEVYCQTMELKNDTESPYVNGSVGVLWNYNKPFDGSIPFRVCRSDLQDSCDVSK